MVLLYDDERRVYNRDEDATKIQRRITTTVINKNETKTAAGKKINKYIPLILFYYNHTAIDITRDDGAADPRTR